MLDKANTWKHEVSYDYSIDVSKILCYYHAVNEF